MFSTYNTKLAASSPELREAANIEVKLVPVEAQICCHTHVDATAGVRVEAEQNPCLSP